MDMEVQLNRYWYCKVRRVKDGECRNVKNLMETNNFLTMLRLNTALAISQIQQDCLNLHHETS
jgi:hypothetical protein